MIFFLLLFFLACANASEYTKPLKALEDAETKIHLLESVQMDALEGVKKTLKYEDVASNISLRKASTFQN